MIPDIHVWGTYFASSLYRMKNKFIGWTGLTKKKVRPPKCDSKFWYSIFAYPVVPQRLSLLPRWDFYVSPMSLWKKAVSQSLLCLKVAIQAKFWFLVCLWQLPGTFFIRLLGWTLCSCSLCPTLQPVRQSVGRNMTLLHEHVSYMQGAAACRAGRGLNPRRF